MNLKLFFAKKVILLTVVLVALSVCPLRAGAQVVSSDSVINCITRTLQTANVDSLAGYLNQRVELSLPDFSGISSRNQAKILLSEFFKSNQPESFNIISSNRENDTYFIVGTIFCSTCNYRVSFLTKQQSNQQFVYQFTIE